MKGDPQVVAVLRELARYLRANPLASDTADSICRWWLDGDFVRMDEVMNALELMQRHRLVEAFVAADCLLRYRRIGSDAEFDRLIGQLNKSFDG